MHGRGLVDWTRACGVAWWARTRWLKLSMLRRFRGHFMATWYDPSNKKVFVAPFGQPSTTTSRS